MAKRGLPQTISTRLFGILGPVFLLLTLPAQAYETLSLPDIVHKTMKLYFSENFGTKGAGPEKLEAFAKSLAVLPQYQKPEGLFVTLSRDGKPRACWGSIEPHYKDLVTATVFTTIGALTRDYRHIPIRQSELDKLKAQVTVIREIEPISTNARLNPMQDGLMLRSGPKTAVILPGEARDAHYQLVQAKLKAGISPKEPFQIYRIKADVFRR